MTKDIPLVNRLHNSKTPVNTALELPSVKKISSDQKPASLKAKQLNVWIPNDLMKRLKVKRAETDKSLKELVIGALEKFI
ncbi:hypothetical protein GCM10027592_03580 [Spirosoma flavus]